MNNALQLLIGLGDSYGISSKTLIFFTALLSSLLFSKLAIWIATRISLIDYPNSRPHKTHGAPTPIAGGLSILLSFSLLAVFGIALFGYIEIDPFILSAVLILFVVGMIDDAFILSARFKLIAQMGVSILLVLGNYQVNVLNSEPINILISIIWFVGIINAFNFIDSSDGLLLGTGIWISIFIVLATINSNQNLLNNLTIAFLGVLVGLYLFNRPPAKMFLGDSGSQIIGLSFSLLALRYNPLGFDRTTSWISPILMMAFPIFDVTLVVFSRLRRREPIFEGRLDHTYHRLQKFTGSKSLANLSIFGLTILTNLLAILNLYLRQGYSYLLFGAVILMGVILFFVFESIHHRQ